MYELKTFVKLLYPVAPHISSEIYEIITNGEKIEQSKWPTYTEDELVQQTIEIPVQVNGKLRGRIIVSKDAEQEEVIKLVNNDILMDKQVIKVIYVKGRILNIVAK